MFGEESGGRKHKPPAAGERVSTQGGGEANKGDPCLQIFRVVFQRADELTKQGGVGQWYPEGHHMEVPPKNT